MNAEILSIVASLLSVGLGLFERKWLNALATKSEKNLGNEIEVPDSNFIVKRMIRRAVASGVLTTHSSSHCYVYHPEVLQSLRKKRRKRMKIIVPLILTGALIGYFLISA